MHLSLSAIIALTIVKGTGRGALQITGIWSRFSCNLHDWQWINPRPSLLRARMTSCMVFIPVKGRSEGASLRRLCFTLHLTGVYGRLPTKKLWSNAAWGQATAVRPPPLMAMLYDISARDGTYPANGVESRMGVELCLVARRACWQV